MSVMDKVFTASSYDTSTITTEVTNGGLWVVVDEGPFENAGITLTLDQARELAVWLNQILEISP